MHIIIDLRIFPIFLYTPIFCFYIILNTTVSDPMSQNEHLSYAQHNRHDHTAVNNSLIYVSVTIRLEFKSRSSAQHVPSRIYANLTDFLVMRLRAKNETSVRCIIVLTEFNVLPDTRNRWESRQKGETRLCLV